MSQDPVPIDEVLNVSTSGLESLILKDYLPPSTDIVAWPTDILPSETFAPDSRDHVSNMNIEVDDFMEIQF